MAHAKTQIRDAVVTALGGLTTTGSRVYPSRVHDLPQNFSPSLLVYTPAEQIADDEDKPLGRPRKVFRTVTVVIEGHATDPDGSDLEDLLDTIDAEVTAALGNSLLGGLVKDLYHVSSETELGAEGAKPAGRIDMTWEADYRTLENDAETIIS